MNKYFPGLLIAFLFVLGACSVSQKQFVGTKKYPPEKLRSDYILLQKILESKHPSLYWYTSKDSMDYYFGKYFNAISDSMNEQEFTWKILVPLVQKIHCGHTSIGMSKAYTNWISDQKLPMFPLYMKVWNDSMLVMMNVNRKDSVIKKGTLIRSIDGIPATRLISTMFDNLPQDGHENSLSYIRLSGNFPYYHRNIFGTSKTYNITFTDSLGNPGSATIPAFVPEKDTTAKKHLAKKTLPEPEKIKKALRYRSLNINKEGHYAVMNLHSFDKGNLRRFFRRSFKELQTNNINNLVIDIRQNGGGRVGLSTLLARYVTRKPFKVADSLYAVSKSLAPYSKYIKGKFFNNLELFFITRKGPDGHFHNRFLERKIFKPKNKSHYNGNLYVLTAGPTFSASAIFCNMIKGQDRVLLMGEPTGGGWYGNNGIMIPDIILPVTKIRVRLPLFRLVQYDHISEKGTGVMPDIYIPTSYDALMKGYDKKMRVAQELIHRQESSSNK